MKGTWRLCSAGVGLSFVWLKGALMCRGILSYWFSCGGLDSVLLYSRSGRGWSYTLRIDALRPAWKTLLSIRDIKTTAVVPPVYFDKSGRGAHPYLREGSSDSGPENADAEQDIGIRSTGSGE